MSTIKNVFTVMVNATENGAALIVYDPMQKIGPANPAHNTYVQEDLPSSNAQINALSVTADGVNGLLDGDEFVGKTVRVTIPSAINARIGALIARINAGMEPNEIVENLIGSSWAWMNDQKNGDPAWAPTLKKMAKALAEAKEKDIKLDFEKNSELNRYELNIMATGRDGRALAALIPDDVVNEETEINLVSEQVDGRLVSHAEINGIEIFCQGVFENGKHKVSASKDSAGRTHYYVERTLPTARMYRTHLLNLRAFYRASFDLLPHEEEVGEDFKFAV